MRRAPNGITYARWSGDSPFGCQASSQLSRDLTGPVDVALGGHLDGWAFEQGGERKYDYRCKHVATGGEPVEVQRGTVEFCAPASATASRQIGAVERFSERRVAARDTKGLSALCMVASPRAEWSWN